MYIWKVYYTVGLTDNPKVVTSDESIVATESKQLIEVEDTIVENTGENFKLLTIKTVQFMGIAFYKKHQK